MGRKVGLLLVGTSVGAAVGVDVGSKVGDTLGGNVGRDVGVLVGRFVGISVGRNVGFPDGCLVGQEVGFIVLIDTTIDPGEEEDFIGLEEDLDDILLTMDLLMFDFFSIPMLLFFDFFFFFFFFIPILRMRLPGSKDATGPIATRQRARTARTSKDVFMVQ